MKSPASKYLLWLGGLTVFLVLLVGALNYAVDPYGIYHYGESGDWVKSRPRIRNVERLHKAYAVRSTQAEALLLGNSRVLTSLAPTHPSIPQPAYNLAISASNIYECERYLEHAASFHQPKLVLFGIDQWMFDADAPNEADFSEQRLAVDKELRPQKPWLPPDLAASLFSTSAVRDSMLTLLGRGRQVRYPQGMRDADLMRPYLNPAHVLSENARWAKDMTTKPFDLRLKKDGSNPQFEAFARVVRYCAARGIRLVIFINPLHAQLLDMGLADGKTYREWMRELLACVEANSRGAVVQPEVWDFCGFNAITTESFPQPGSAENQMRYFWEVSHFRREVGDWMLDTMLAGKTNPLDGERLTAATLDARYARMEAERQKWLAGPQPIAP
jgi:hypothetical protein